LSTLTWTSWRAREPAPKRKITDSGSMEPVVRANHIAPDRGDGSRQSSLGVVATNAPGNGEENVYASSALSQASSNTYDLERRLLEEVVSVEDNNVVDTFMSLLEQGGDARESKEERAVRVGRTGRSVHIVLDTRSPYDVGVDKRDGKTLDARLAKMDAPFLDPDKYVLYANGNKDVPSTLWKHSQVVIAEASRYAVAAKIDEYFDNALPQEQQAYKLASASGAKAPLSSCNRLREQRGLVPIAGGATNFAYQWNDAFHPGDDATTQRVNTAREYFKTHVPPLTVPAGLHRDTILRVPNSVGSGNTIEAAIDTVHQYIVASKHDVGVRVSAAIIFDVNRLHDDAVWEEEKSNFAQILPGAVKGVANGLKAYDRPRIGAKKYGVILVVERMEIETNFFMVSKEMNSIFQPRVLVDGIGLKGNIDDTQLAMCSIWKLLAKMSSVGFVYFDAHLGNVMFKREGSGYVAKLVDIDPKFGRLLSYAELHGINADRSWKALLVLNALTLAMALAGDLNRIRLFTKWVSSDKVSATKKLSGAAFDIGHFNRFKKMCKEVSESIKQATGVIDGRMGETGSATSEDGKDAKFISVPEELLSVLWKGGYRGTGIGDSKEGATTLNIFSQPHEATKEVLQRYNAMTTDSYDLKTDSTFVRMEAALRESTYHRSVHQQCFYALDNWKKRQGAISALLGPQNTPQPQVDQSMSFPEVNTLIINASGSSSARQALSSSDGFIRNEFDQVSGPLMRYAGKIRADGILFIDFLSEYVFTHRYMHKPAFKDSSILTSPLHPHHNDYNALFSTRVKMLRTFDDPTDVPSTREAAEAANMVAMEVEKTPPPASGPSGSGIVAMDV